MSLQQRLSLETVRSAGIVNTSAAGVPVSIVNTSEAGVKAFVRVCSDDWFLMPEPTLSANCIVCPRHRATFNACSGEVADSKKRRIPEGLRPLDVTVADGLVDVHVVAADYVYLAKVLTMRVLRALRIGRRRGRRS